MAAGLAPATFFSFLCEALQQNLMVGQWIGSNFGRASQFQLEKTEETLVKNHARWHQRARMKP